MAEFLDTSATTYHLERLIKSACQYLWLISPYLQFNDRIKELLSDKAHTQTETEVRIVYGKRAILADNTTKWLASHIFKLAFAKTYTPNATSTKTPALSAA